MAAKKKAKKAAKKKKASAKKSVKKKTPARKAKPVAKKKATARKKAAKKEPAKKSVKKTVKAAARKAPAKKKAVKKKQIMGEGDYAASAKFDADQASFVKRNKAAIPGLGKDAESALDGPEGDALRDAEAAAAGRSRDTFAP